MTLPIFNGAETTLREADARYGDPTGSRNSGAGKMEAGGSSYPPDFSAEEDEGGNLIDMCLTELDFTESNENRTVAREMI